MREEFSQGNETVERLNVGVHLGDVKPSVELLNIVESLDHNGSKSAHSDEEPLEFSS